MSVPLEIFARAIRSGNLAQVDLMIDDKSIDVCARLPRIHNPPALVYAVKCNQIAIVRALLRANASIDDVDDFGLTACHVAVDQSDEEMLRQLLVYSPNLGILDLSKHSALKIAMRFCKYQHAAMLIDHGAPLADVAQELFRFSISSTAAIQALQKRDVIVRDSRQESPLIIAVSQFSNSSSVLHALVNDCDIDVDTHSRLGFRN
jgi:ankyrin repeat protein